MWSVAGLGFLAGALVRGVIGYVSLHSDPAYGAGHEGRLGAALGALIGGGVGLVIGAVVGSRQTESWEGLRLPISLGIRPGAGTVSCVASFMLR